MQIDDQAEKAEAAAEERKAILNVLPSVRKQEVSVIVEEDEHERGDYDSFQQRNDLPGNKGESYIVPLMH